MEVHFLKSLKYYQLTIKNYIIINNLMQYYKELKPYIHLLNVAK